MKTVEFSIRRPVTVTMFFLAVAVFGVVSFDQLPLNLLPEISYPTLTVRTRYPGAAPAEVENLISKRIENAVGVVNNVIRVSSVSRPEISDVVIEFSWKTDMDFAGLDVREKLDLLTLPLSAEKPILLRYDPSADPIMRVSLTGSSKLAALRYLAEEFVKPALESLVGVAAIRVSGGLEDEIYVELDENRLASLGISIQDATRRLAEENINRTGGTLREGQSRYLVRTLNEFGAVDEINDVVVSLKNGVPVRVADIGDVYSGYKERQIITRINGEESVEIAVFKAADANTVTVAREVRAGLETLEADYAGRETPLVFIVVYDQSRFIQNSIREVLSTALWGGVLAIFVLLLFLRSLKTTGIIALSIPISIVSTFFLMYAFNVSLNIMSLSGLALGIGMLVDNSIVVLESIFRKAQKGLPPKEAANLGATEVGSAVVASTLTTVCVFAPIVFVEGVAGQLFRDQALTVTFSLLASLVVAILLIPMLSSLGRQQPRQEAKVVGGDPPSGLRRAYLGLLRLALNHRMAALSSVLVLFAVSVLAAERIGSELIPEISQGEFFVDLELPAGTPLEETSDRIGEVEKAVAGVEGVAQYYTIVGSGNQSGVSAVEEKEHIGQIQVRLEPGRLHQAEDQAIESLRGAFKGVPGVDYKFARPNLFSFKRPIEVVVQGYNLTALKGHAERVKERLEELPGIRDLRASTEGSNPEIQIRFDRRRLTGQGLTVDQAAATIRNKVQGEIASEFNEENRKIDIRVRLLEEDRRSTQELSNLVLDVPNRAPVHLSTVAEIAVEEGPAEIRRIGPERAAVITGSLVGRDLDSVVQDIQQVLDQFPIPEGFRAYVAGQSEEQVAAFESMQFAILLSIFLVYLVMASQFESFVQPFVIMFAIPFGLVGVVLALLLAGQVLNVVVLIGGVVLAGIVVNNSIVLIDYTNRLKKAGAKKAEAIERACSVRLRPILMTTSTTVLGLLPMLVNQGEGSELRIPLAVTLIGGLVVSTLLTLVLVPVLYSLAVREVAA